MDMNEKSFIPPDCYAFTDGSYNENTKEYGYGVMLFVNGKESVFKGKGSDTEYAESRNISGEVFGAMVAVKEAALAGAKEITLFYDYQGKEEWALGRWKRNKRLTKTYAEYMDNAMKHIKINFKHVKGHAKKSDDPEYAFYRSGNNKADKLAREAVGVD